MSKSASTSQRHTGCKSKAHFFSKQVWYIPKTHLPVALFWKTVGTL
jgi:hypothetical protein